VIGHPVAAGERLGWREACGRTEGVARDLAVEDVVAVPDDAIGVDLREPHVELDRKGRAIVLTAR
jgi:hypothetical protein